MATTLITITSLVSPPARVQIDPYGTNPIAADYQQVNAGTYAISLKDSGPPPMMFDSGTANLPSFTSSGLDPALLMKLPYTARHYVASLPDLAQCYPIFDEGATDPYLRYDCTALSDAIGRVRDWAAGRSRLVLNTGA